MTPDNLLNYLEKATNEQLTEWKQAIDSEIEKRQSRERAEARKKIRELAETHGIDLASLSPGVTGKKHEAKYRNPENQFITWSGIGRKPKWVAEWLAAGKALDDLRIK